MNKKMRADNLVVYQGLAENPPKARALIMAGLVFSQQERVEKPGQLLDKERDLILKEKLPFVSRGGLKLAEALEEFNFCVDDKTAADLGASTGGFTDCLLQRGARKVFAVDVDTRQLDWNLRKDPRVVMINKNARYLEKKDFSNDLDLITMDVSFISVLKILPAIKGFLENGDLISLIKPQFEVRKEQVGKKGIVQDPSLHEEVMIRIIDQAQDMGFQVKGVTGTSVKGQKGNREFFIRWSLNSECLSPKNLKGLVKEVAWNAKN